MAKHKATPNLSGPDAYRKELVSLLEANARSHRMHQVFSDFVELAALSISNAVDKASAKRWEVREARYMQIIKGYTREEIERFPQMLAMLVEWLECGFADRMGELFMSLNMGDKWKGQFFTPYHLSSCMASLILGEAKTQIEHQGFITFNEPACGAGGMLVACADAIHAQGINYQQTMHATAVDIDATAVHMTYIQLALYHVPAIVIHGNALALTEWDHWVTPAHVLGGWDWRLRRRAAAEREGAKPVPRLPTPLPRAEPVQEEHTAADIASAPRAIVAQRTTQLGLFA